MLYTLRVSQKNHGGTVSVLYDRLRLLRKSSRVRNDPQATALRHILLALINLMASVSPEEAYIIVDVDDQKRSERDSHTEDQTTESLQMNKRRRVVVTLEDLKREYQDVLDRCSRVERGDFDFEIEEDDEIYDGDVADRSRLNLFSRLSVRKGFEDGSEAIEM